jgi:hypothetical protein
LGITLGMHNNPIVVSGGIFFHHGSWQIHLAFEYCMDNGSTPSSSLTYAW